MRPMRSSATKVRYQCGVCDEVVEVSESFVSAPIPATCPVCLRSTWLTRPTDYGPIVSVPASGEAEERLALLEAEAADAERTAREDLKKSRRGPVDPDLN